VTLFSRVEQRHSLLIATWRPEVTGSLPSLPENKAKDATIQSFAPDYISPSSRPFNAAARSFVPNNYQPTPFVAFKLHLLRDRSSI
jgi:hypothetical protein